MKTGTLLKIHTTHIAFYNEIKKEFYARYRREGKSKYSKTDLDQFSTMGWHTENAPLTILDYRFTKKNEAYFVEKTNSALFIYNERKALRNK